MKMNKVKNIAVLLAAALLTMACNGFLDKMPDNRTEIPEPIASSSSAIIGKILPKLPMIALPIFGVIHISRLRTQTRPCFQYRN